MHIDGRLKAHFDEVLELQEKLKKVPKEARVEYLRHTIPLIGDTHAKKMKTAEILDRKVRNAKSEDLDKLLKRGQHIFSGIYATKDLENGFYAVTFLILHEKENVIRYAWKEKATPLPREAGNDLQKELHTYNIRNSTYTGQFDLWR